MWVNNNYSSSSRGGSPPILSSSSRGKGGSNGSSGLTAPATGVDDARIGQFPGPHRRRRCCSNYRNSTFVSRIAAAVSVVMILMAPTITTGFPLSTTTKVSIPPNPFSGVVVPRRSPYFWNHHTKKSASPLFMGKSMNKQAELRRKLELAKQQKEQKTATSDDEEDATNSKSSSSGSNSSNHKKKQALSDKEIKERNDRLRFEELLKKSTSTVLNDYSKDGYLNRQQEEKELMGGIDDDDGDDDDELQEQRRRRRRKKQRQSIVDRLFEGDDAPEDCFQELYNIRTETPIGKGGMERILPWLKYKQSSDKNNNNNNRQDYVLCLVDPRDKSPELRQAVKSLATSGQLSSSLILRRMVIINADTPAENRRWLKRNKYIQLLQDGVGGGVDSSTTTTTSPFSSFQGLYCDEKMEWMRTYSALGEDRWSMTLFLLAEGKIQKIVRDLDVYAVEHVVPKVVDAYQTELRLPSTS